MKIAVIMTVHNRIECTVRAIRSIIDSSSTLQDVSLSFYVCDDGSSDGTCEVLTGMDIDIHVIKGHGNLFFSRGMYVAMKSATETRYDLYLMINNDAEFMEDALNTMIDAYNCVGGPCGIVGSSVDNNGKITHCGRIKSDNSIVVPNGRLQKCDLGCWNCFLTDNYAIDNIGLIDPRYRHGFGDYDYTLRMKKKGIPVYVAPKYVAVCDNEHDNTYLHNRFGRTARLRDLFSPCGCPVGSTFLFFTRHYGIKGFVNTCIMYTKTICYIIWGKEVA